MTPFLKKLISFVAAVAAVITANLLLVDAEHADARGWVMFAAGALIGSVGVRRPGDKAAVAILILALLPGCAFLRSLPWGQAAACGAGVVANLAEALEEILGRSEGKLSHRDKADLQELALVHGVTGVKCGAEALVSRYSGEVEPGVYSATKLDPKKRHVVERGQEFLDLVQPKAK